MSGVVGDEVGQDPGGSARRPTIVIVDDAADVRALVRSRLRVSGRLDVVGEGATGVEAVEAVRRHRPDLLLLDVSMPQMDGLVALPQVLEASPGTRVAMYSGFSEDGLAHRAIELGAAAFLEKSTPLDVLVDRLLALLDADPEAPAPGEEDRTVLREHQERFREVFDDAAIGMATVTLAGQVVRANGALAALLGRDADGLVGLPYADLTAGRADLVDDALAEILDGRSRVVQIEHDVTGVTPPRRVLATVAPVLDSGERPLYLFWQVQDVTAQRQAEEELRRSETRFRLLVENVEDYAIFMLSPEGLVESWNAGAQRIKGYTESEIVGRHFRTFYPPELQESRHPEHELELALRDGHYEEEGWRVRKDGGRFWANVLITAVHDQAGRHIGFAKITRDTTERRVMLENAEAAAGALAEANAQLQQAAEDQAHFLAVTAHELRTPVGVLAGTAEMLAEHAAELDAEERRELLAGMGSSAARLRRLLADLLTASRLQASALELEVETLDVGALVAAAAAAARRAHPGAEVEATAEPGLLVEGDRDRLGQAVDNLVANALRHGSPPVQVSARAAEADPGTVEIEVRDAGPGVSEEMRERLFGRFATGRSGGGTGLGLYIVRQLARSHDGDAAYRPDGGGGSAGGSFVLTLPRAGADAVR
ncbi:PAS domain S-box protein [Nocardioides sp.]|uniref:PAS domain S-box protein n=1 Tax=Nocardioides sp. TaxID=35761 RepID=UPI002619D536|nr:PAS domain S-box protein [Nocardioides sp.]MDI6910834.1 PAS domain S-box protein [Nocardioides sp.]